jgi:tyrosinase
VRRDFRPETTRNTLNYENITLTLSQPDLISFSRRLDTAHSAGHAGIGGMNDDLYAGNGDPAFYFHHAQVDHIWTIWQAQNLEERLEQVTGTLTISNSKWLSELVRDSMVDIRVGPPSANGTLDTTMDLGYNGGMYAIRDLVSTIDGPFCYIYE